MSKTQVAMEGLGQALRNLGNVPLSEMGDAESDAIRAAIDVIRDAQEQLKSSLIDRERAPNR